MKLVLSFILKCLLLQKLQSSRGKSTEKSPQEEQKSTPGVNEAVWLDNLVKLQGDKIRQLKSDKATKVIYKEHLK